MGAGVLTDGRDLMRRAQAGDIDAFAQIYATYRPLVLHYARTRNSRLAEDITQDVFVRALGALHQWRDQGKDLGAWLLIITVNLCRDRVKAAYCRSTLLVPEVPERPTLDRDDPAELAIEGLVRADVLRALSKLSARQREALFLLHLQDLSVAQCAARMEISPSHFRTLTFKARKKMAALLQGAVDA